MPASLLSINPVTNQVLETDILISNKEVRKKNGSANSQFNQWKGTSIEYRKKLVKKLSILLKEGKNVLGLLIINEMGKILKESVSEIEKCAWVCESKNCD